MIRKILFVLIWFLLYGFVFAQSHSGEYNETIKQSENLAYNFKFDEARVLAIRALSQMPERPEAFHQIAQTYLWYYLGSKNIAEYYKFINYSDSSLTRAENLLDKNPNNTNLLFLMGNIYKLRAIAFAEKQETLSGFWATKKAVGYFEDVLDIDNTFYAAYAGIGMFEYALGFVPNYLKWALRVTGLSPDKKEGFTKIEKALELSKRNLPEIKFHAAKLYDEYLADYPKAIEILKTLVDEFPGNSLFHYQLGLEYLKNKNLDEANKELDIVLEINHPKFIQTNSFANFLKGDVYFFQNKFDKALDYYLTFLKTSQTIDYTGIASFKTAICYYFSGLGNNLELFKRYLILAGNGNLDIEEDNYANEVSKSLSKYGITHPHAEIVKIENMFAAGNYKELIQTVTKNLSSFQDSDLKAMALIYLAGSYLETNDLGKVNPLLDEVLNIKVKREFWIKPMALFYKAKLKFKMKDYGRIEPLLNNAEKANEFNKKNLIQSYINGLRKKIKELGY